MSSSSEEEEEELLLAKYGSPMVELEEPEIAKKPIAIHEQIVTDEQGRRRFHGAFTGGFSAGYYNTVDTPEGWVPTSFRSTRKDRKENKNYVPEDFMDEEDLSEHGIAPNKIMPQRSFSTAKKLDQKDLRRKENFAKNATMLLGLDMLQSLVIPVSSNIGITLLQRMGWKPGQGIGPKVKRPKKSNVFMPDNVEFAPADCVPIMFTPKVNAFGLGYTGMDPKRALHDKVKKSSAIAVRTKTGAKLSFAGQAFGVGAYEDEDQDIYAQDSMANYDLVINDEKSDESFGWSKPTKAVTAGVVSQAIMNVAKALDDFKKAEKNVRRKKYAPPILPPDYDPFRRAKVLQKFGSGANSSVLTAEEEREKKFERLQPDQRGEMLGEKRTPAPKEFTETDSIFTLLKPKDRQRLQIMKHGGVGQPVPPRQPKKSGFYEPFSTNPSKQDRYAQYLRLLRSKEPDPYSKIEHDHDMTEWEREQEREEFIKSSRFFQPLSATMSSRFAPESEDLKQKDAKEDSQRKAVKMKMFGLITRDSFEWHPDPLLCKRFNIPNPYPHSDIVGIPGRNSSSQAEMFLHPDDFKNKSKLKRETEVQQKSLIPVGSKTTGILSDTKDPTFLSRHSNKPSRWDEQVKITQTELPTDTAAPSGDESKDSPAPFSTKIEDSAASHSGEEGEESSSEDEEKDEENAKPTRPSMDIFKAIFENSDSSSSDSEEEEEILTRSTNVKKTNNESSKLKKMETSSGENTDNATQSEQLGDNVLMRQSALGPTPDGVNRSRFHKFSLPAEKRVENRVSDPSAGPRNGLDTNKSGQNSDKDVGPNALEARPGVNLPELRFHELAHPGSKKDEDDEADTPAEEVPDFSQPQNMPHLESQNSELESQTEGSMSSVNRPHFHKFLSKRDRLAVKRTVSPEKTLEPVPMAPGETFGPPLPLGDSFGPALPPVKVPKLWATTEPESLKSKKAKKSKHKNKKHKKEKKRK